MVSVLRECFDRNKCDKGSKHNYELIYEEILNCAMQDINDGVSPGPLTILEIGIYKGASIKSFIEFFSYHQFENYEIWAIDTFQRIKPQSIEILKHPKIQWFTEDSTKPYDKLNELPEFEFDLIIDDGLHTPEAQMKTFQNYWPSLKLNGSYIIEDVWPLHLMTDEERRNQWWLRKYHEEFEYSKHEKLMKVLKENSLDVIEHDHRYMTREPDSFCFEIAKPDTMNE